jgi:hypothetical protein
VADRPAAAARRQNRERRRAGRAERGWRLTAWPIKTRGVGLGSAIGERIFKPLQVPLAYRRRPQQWRRP